MTASQATTDISNGTLSIAVAGLCTEPSTLVGIKSPLYLIEKKNGNSNIKPLQGWSRLKGNCSALPTCFYCQCDFSQEKVGAWVLIDRISSMAFPCVLVSLNTLPVGEMEHGH